MPKIPISTKTPITIGLAAALLTGILGIGHNEWLGTQNARDIETLKTQGEKKDVLTSQMAEDIAVIRTKVEYIQDTLSKGHR